MTGLYSTLKIGLITIALMASYPTITLAGDSGRQEKAKTFNELLEEKGAKEDYDGMEEVVNRQLSILLKETKKIDSELEACMEEKKAAPEKCREGYTSSGANYIKKQKGDVDNLLNMLAKKKNIEGDYEGAEATLNTELSLISQEIESHKVGLKYCNAYAEENIQRTCKRFHESKIGAITKAKARILYSLGSANEAKPDLATALDYYRQAKDLDPGNPYYDRKIKGLLKQMPSI